jgi:hypothetical protein
MWLPCNQQIGGELKHAGALTTFVWVPAGIALLYCVISQLRPSYWQTLAWGAIIVIAGSAMTQLLPKCRGRKWLKVARGVAIGVVIAGGTFVSTYGWNERSGHLRDRALLTAVAAELDLNQIYIELLSLAHQRYEVTGNLDAMTALPLPTTNHIGQAVTASSVYGKDSEFANAVFLYVIAADSLAARLKKIDLVCSSHIVSAEMAKPIIDSAFKDKGVFESFRDQHKGFAGQLDAKYDWCFGEGKNRMRKPVLDDFYRSVVLPRQMELNTLDHQQRMKRFIDNLKAKRGLVPIPSDSEHGKSEEDPNG